MAKQQHLPASTPVPPPQYYAEPHPGSRPPEQETSAPSLGQVFTIIRRRKWTVLGCFLVVFAAFGVYTYLQTPEYEATAVLNIESDGSSSQISTVIPSSGPQDPNAAMESLLSPQVALAVAERMIAEETIPQTDVPFTALAGIPADAPNRAAVLAQRLQNSYLTTTRRTPRLVSLNARSPVPQEAAYLANTYAEEFIDYSRETSRARSASYREFLDEMATRFDTEVAAAEDELTQYLNSVGVTAPSQLGRELLTQVQQLRQTRSQAQVELATAATELRALEGQMDQLTPGLNEQLTSRDDLMIDRLAGQIADLELQREQILARNPDAREQDPTGQLADIERQIERFNDQLRQHAERLLQSAGAGAETTNPGQATGSIQSKMAQLYTLRQQIVQKQVAIETMQARLEEVNEQLAELEPQLSSIPAQDVAVNRLNRDLQIKEGLYERLLRSLQEARLTEEAQPGQATIVAEALVPLSPLSPNVERNLIAGALIGLLFGIGMAFARHAMDNQIHTPQDLQHEGYTLLGVIPNMNPHIKQAFQGKERVHAHGRPFSTRLLAHLSPQSPVADGYRRLRTNLDFSGTNGPVRTILVTSSTPNEGKTVTALNLAYTMAQSGRRTLYIDADLHQPAGHRLVPVQQEPGLVDLLQGNPPPSLDEAIVDADGVSILPAGSRPGNFAAELLYSTKMRELLAELRERYDMIVIDTAPVLAVADAILLSSICDASILVSRAGVTPQVALARATEALSRVGTPIAGVVLNGFVDRTSKGYDGYGYYGQFGYGADAASGNASGDGAANGTHRRGKRLQEST